MRAPFHEGEREMQRRAGVAEEAGALGRGIRAGIPDGVAPFLHRQRMAVAASLEPGGRVWASLLAGPEGFLQVVEDRLLFLATAPIPGDPLAANLAVRPELGLLVLDPRTRQRLRLNGRGLATAQGVFLRADQVYGNCPKYIQRRTLDDGPRPRAAREPRLSRRLTPGQQESIRQADTFFIASFHPEGGADASHRGGRPGFVRVLSPGRLAFDDYPGNNMFNTLGNLVAHPRAGLLFVDFTTGDLLQLAGTARVGDDRTVVFEVEAVRETPGGSPLRFTLQEYSPFNPGPAGAGPSTAAEPAGGGTR